MRVLDLGHDLWRKRISTADFPTWGQVPRLVPLVRLARRLGLARFAAESAIRLDAYYPIVLLAAAKEPRAAVPLP